MNQILEQIIDDTKKRLKQRKSLTSITELDRSVRKLNTKGNFLAQLSKNNLRPGFIAEIKLASPSVGDLGEESEIETRVQIYKELGADAISVITEKDHFLGDLSFINRVKKQVGLPVLQKDFVVDMYQIYESKVTGADALLLIAKIIPPDTLKDFVDIALELNLEPVVEINDEYDLSIALQTQTRIIAVNARNLDDFSIDTTSACKLLKQIPDTYFKLGFSGISSKKDILRYQENGAKGVLVGSSIMKNPKLIKELTDAS